MDRWHQAIEAACEAVRGAAFYDDGTPKRLPIESVSIKDAIAAIRSIPAPEPVGEERPMCSGKWVRGSGGHREHEPCDKQATWWCPKDMWAYCDEHIVEHDKRMLCHMGVIKSAPAPEPVGEEEAVQEVRKVVRDGVMAFVMGGYEPDDNGIATFERTVGVAAFRAALAVVRSHDRREADEVREVLHRYVSIAGEMARLIGAACPDNPLWSDGDDCMADRLDALEAAAAKMEKA